MNIDNTKKFNKLLAEKNINKAELARQLNIKPQNITQYIDAGRFPTKYDLTLLKILGSGALDFVEKSNVEYYKSILNEPSAEYGVERIPYFNVDFCAGFDVLENSLQNTPDAYISDPLFFGSQYVVRCFGDSMGDKIPNGCYLGIRQIDVSDILFGEIYAVVTPAHRTVKYLRKSKLADHILFVPENLVGYDPQDVPISKIKSVWAVVAYGLKIN